MSRHISKMIVLFTVVVIALLAGLLVFQVSSSGKNEAGVWINTFEKAVVPHLVESDYAPLVNKLDLLKRTELFESVSVYNRNNRWISGFGDESLQGCDGRIIRNLHDENGIEWGTLCYSVNAYHELAVLAFPLSMLFILLIGMSVVLAYFVRRNLNSEEKRILYEKSRAELLHSIASQVAHDIRSPLAALEMVTANSKTELTVSDREIIRNSLNRIKDIANILLSRHANRKESITALDQEVAEQPTAELFSPLVESVVSEARVRFSSDPRIRITCEVDDSALSAFVKVTPGDLKRIVSNLINNAVEAIQKDSVLVKIRIFAEAETLKLEIADNGKGMPDSVRSQLGKPGVTFGKEMHAAAGSGLGVSHAVKRVRDWGGSIEYTTKEGFGTTATVSFPIAEPAAWFPTSIRVGMNSIIVVCDDDEAIHKIWESRFTGFTVVSLRSIREFKHYYRNHFHELDDVFFLIDQHYQGEDDLGFSLIDGLSLAEAHGRNRIFLSSSEYESLELREKCLARGISLLPKPLIQLIPIRIDEKDHAA